MVKYIFIIHTISILSWVAQPPTLHLNLKLELLHRNNLSPLDQGLLLPELGKLEGL